MTVHIPASLLSLSSSIKDPPNREHFCFFKKKKEINKRNWFRVSSVGKVLASQM